MKERKSGTELISMKLGIIHDTIDNKNESKKEQPQQ